MEFTYGAYEKLLYAIASRGYTFTDFLAYEGADSPCILRHDVDMSLPCALSMAQSEARAGEALQRDVHATYFVLLSTDFYNVHALESRRILDELLTLGHSIGLHFDEAQYPEIAERGYAALYERVAEELAALSRIVGAPVRAVSMHRPSKGLLEANLSFPDAVNTYSDTFFKGFRYLSDSRMHWREDVFAALETEQDRRFQILTHPIWYGETERSMREILTGFIRSAGAERLEQLGRNIRQLDEIVGKDAIEP